MPISRTDWLKSAPITPTSGRADTPLFPFLSKLIRREDLSYEEAADMFRSLIDPAADPSQMAGILTALTAKGETSDELAGMASVIRSAAVRIGTPPKGAVDIVGTGSSAARTFNVSTAAAIVAAGAGLIVAKQCNRGITAHLGSADVIEEMGVKIAHEPNVAHKSLSASGMCFLFAPKFHPRMLRIGEVRSHLGIRTCLNVLGLISNPVGVSRQLIGVWHKSLVEPVANALAKLGSEAAWVVHGADGLDEITLAGETFIAVVKGGQVRTFVVTPVDFGLRTSRISQLRTESPKESAKMIRDVLLSRRRDEARSLIVLNAAAALVIGGITKDPMHAARLAEQSIDSGMAQNKLERLQQITNKAAS